MYNRVWYFCTFLYGLSRNEWHALFCIVNNRHGVTITTHAIKRHFLIWVTTVRQPAKSRCPRVLTVKCTFICIYWWTRRRIQNTLIVVDRYLRLMGDKTIPDSAEPRLESFYPPFVAGIDLPHQGVVDSYSLRRERWSFRHITCLKLIKKYPIYCLWHFPNYFLHASTILYSKTDFSKICFIVNRSTMRDENSLQPLIILAKYR